MTRTRSLAAALPALLVAAVAAVPARAVRQAAPAPAMGAAPADPFRVWKVPNVTEGAECYFSPDGRSLVFNGKMAGDANHQVYTVGIDGTGLRRINAVGADACSYWRPDGRALIWTSTRDHLDMRPGNYSDPRDYPQGAEIYTSDLEGGNVVRLTSNSVYDAEVTWAPDGHRILFGRQTDGRMDLWTMAPDGSGPRQITFTPDWQEGGAVYMPDNRTIITRAWRKSEEGSPARAMHLFLVEEDGSNLRQITFEDGVQWAPYPAPDGAHAAFVKVLPPRNYEIYLLDLATGAQTRLTANDAFDGFPSISPDGRLLAFSSTRGAAAGTRSMSLWLMDVSSLGLGREAR